MSPRVLAVLYRAILLQHNLLHQHCSFWNAAWEICCFPQHSCPQCHSGSGQSQICHFTFLETLTLAKPSISSPQYSSNSLKSTDIWAYGRVGGNQCLKCILVAVPLIFWRTYQQYKRKADPQQGSSKTAWVDWLQPGQKGFALRVNGRMNTWCVMETNK